MRYQHCIGQDQRYPWLTFKQKRSINNVLLLTPPLNGAEGTIEYWMIQSLTIIALVIGYGEVCMICTLQVCSIY